MSEKIPEPNLHDSTNGAQTVYLDYRREKRQVLWLIVIVLVGISISWLVSPTIKVGSETVVMSVFSKIGWLGASWILLFLFYALFYLPLRVVLTRQADGSLFIDKRDWFFLRKTYHLRKEQNAALVARRKKIVGTTVFIGAPIYQPLIRYTEGGTVYEVNLILRASYWMRGMGPRGVFSREHLEAVAAQLDLPFSVEEKA